MPTKRLIPFLPYAAISLVHCILIIFSLPGRGYATKQLLMPALALAVVWALWDVRPWPRGAGILLLLGIAASWLGDGAGLFVPNLPTVAMMILFFAIAHIAYIVLFARAPGMTGVRRVPRWSAVFLVWYIAMVAYLAPHTGSLLIPVVIYGVVLGATAALAPRLSPIVALGGIFFLISDTVLAFRLFIDIPGILGDVLIMPTYTLGQGLIAYGVVRLLRASAAQEHPV